MKKFCVLLVCLSMAISSFAQDTFTWGVKGGLNLTSIYGGDFKNLVSSKSMKANFYAGLMSEFRLSNLIAVGPEIVYSAQGVHYKTNFEILGSNDIKVKLNSHYLNIPIMCKFYITENLSLNVGPQVGFNLGMKVKADGDKEKVNKDLYHKVDFAACAGITYNFSRLFVEARYNLGLTNVMKNFNNKNNAIQIGIGFKF